MDLINDYGDSDSDDDDDGERSNHIHSENNADTANTLRFSGKNEKQSRVVIVPSKGVPANTFVRSVPHVPGNWTGHVFCSVPSTSEAWRDASEESVRRFQQYLEHHHSNTAQTLQIISHLDTKIHMSLSRPFTLQLSSIESFVAKLQQRLGHLPATTLRVRPSDALILVNDERTRSFWSWPIDVNQTLIAIMEEINAVLHIYSQPPYYDPPVFHVSLASVVGDFEQAMTKKPKMVEKAPPLLLLLPIRQILCTFGTTKHFSIDLKDW